jgi:predicted sulfurtransferase
MKKLSISLVLLVVFAALSFDQTVNPALAIGFRLPEGARRITPAELQELIKQDQAIIVDVRSEEAYKAGHIKGARLIPAPDIAKRVDELPRDKLIATYCA